MNSTTPPGTPGNPPEGSGNARPAGNSAGSSAGNTAGTGFFSWIRSLGISRGYDRWFAGVAGGLATRAGIDPLIVRGIFIVLAILGGPGLLLYAIGWLLLPDQGGRIHLEEVFRGRAGTAAVVASVAVGAIIVFSFGFNILGFSGFNEWRPWGFFGVPEWLSVTITVFVWITVVLAMIFIAGQLFLRHGRKVREEGSADQNTTIPPAASAASAAPATPSASSAQAPGAQAPGAETGNPFDGEAPPTAPLGERVEDWSRKASEGAERFSARAAEWGENVGKQADDWSVRYAEHHDRFKLGPAHIIITLALAFLAGGTAALWAVRYGDFGISTVLTAALLAATGTLGLSIILAGIRGRHSGGIGFLAFCGVVGLTFTSILPAGTQFQPFGVQHVVSGAPSAVLIAGTSEIDLTNRATGSAGTTDAGEEQMIWTVFGNANVTLPADAPYEVKVRVLAGNVSGPDSSGRITSTSGPLVGRTLTSGAPEADSRDSSSINNRSVNNRSDNSHSETAATQTVTIYMLGGNVRVREELSR